ncbi:MAG: hypothetical protein ACE5KF_08815 [Kiloniellaceae bacterium]
MDSILVLGFLVGMQHALEADHIAAVASIATGERSIRRIVRHGVTWGLGHTLSLLLFGGTVVLLGAAVPHELARGLEFAVGVMLIVLGGWVLRRLVRDRIHVHIHSHDDGVVHVHAHSHAGDSNRHGTGRHEHTHPPGIPFRTWLIGMMHGMAGSAALLLLTAASIGSAPLGLLYIALFGVGSIMGMAALSTVIAVPLSYSARALTRAHRGLQAAIGLVTVLIGTGIVYETTLADWIGA